ncbi:hypothetical protein OF83DRAFT_57011 [Amylostereum chailletii]|nr:hypothetical protein OF83DRAFT_57011 [Amylostereum chailletii]
MSMQHRHHLSRLNIPPPLQQQHPMHPQQPMFSPALPTAFHPNFPPQTALQTPMQVGFFPPPNAPMRPMHRAHPSLALASAGIHPPGIPMTPLGNGQFPPGMVLAQTPFTPMFPPVNGRHRGRQPSVSTGGPPKAQLGGAGKNYRPPSPTATPVAPAPVKSKRGAVALPKETVPGADGAPATRQPWARTPLPHDEVPPQPLVPPPEIASADIYPPDIWRRQIPDTVDVFLPGKAAWEPIKQRVIDQKLEKLGVEKGLGSYSTVPNILAPHARAASISSPADPALLFFKLNKLQQSQNSSLAQSESPSPLPSSPGQPHPLPPRLQNRHGYSFSLAPFQPASATYHSTGASNPFGPHAILGSDTIFEREDALVDASTMSDPGAPTDQSLAPPAGPPRADSRPDFVRGFGLDIPEEEEPPEEEDESGEDFLGDASRRVQLGGDDTMEMEFEAEEGAAGDEETEEETEDERGLSTVAQSRIHSRHVSRLSAALSLLSVGGTGQDSPRRVGHAADHEAQADDHDMDAVGEWTGSEDLRTTEETTEDEGSIGEWSNPSDEERARQDRIQRRLTRRSQHEIQLPRRIPNFPQPPRTGTVYSLGVPDDLVSNPSEEETEMHARFADNRPMTGSSALAHSRHTSETFNYPGAVPSLPIAAPIPKRNEMLNPFAKPFVFGSNRVSGSFAPGTFGQSPSAPLSSQNSGSNTPGHARMASFGKPLNAAAAEFRPGTFTFRPSGPDVPKFTFPPPQPPASQPMQMQLSSTSPPPQASPIRATQGREKRQRRLSASEASGEEESEVGHDTMSSFKFPPDSPERRRTSAPTSPTQASAKLNAAARPFTLPSHSTFAIREPVGSTFAPREPMALPKSPRVLQLSPEPENQDQESDEEGPALGHQLPIPPTMKARRAPIPLDFKHPVSTNTVPAGLFKALGNNEDERTRRTVRSRLSSREFFEYEHPKRSDSLDDVSTMPAISRKVSRGRLVTDPGRWEPPHQQRAQTMIAPVVKHHRRSSLPAMSTSSISGESIRPNHITQKLEMQHYEDRLEALLDEKLDILRAELHERGDASMTMPPATESMINEVVSLFRAQLQESAARGLDDSQSMLDARGELDFQLVKDVVEQGHAEARAAIRRDFEELVRRVDMLKTHDANQSQNQMLFNLQPIVEDFHKRTIATFHGAVSQLAARMEGLERGRITTNAGERDGLVRELMNGLVPHLAALRAEPIDYEGLTDKLTQAVKPHISQLIDLASDKRETAGLIVDKLIPILPSIYPPSAQTPHIDMAAVISQITNEVRRIVAPVDAHEIKEQVSDLVVERLDSRLAVRDRALDAFSSKVTEGVESLVQPVKVAIAKMSELASGQDAIAAQTRGLASLHGDVLGLLADWPAKLAAATDALSVARADLATRGPETQGGHTAATAVDLSSSPTLLHIGSTVDAVSNGQKTLDVKLQELATIHHEILARFTELAEPMAAIKAIQTAHAELLTRSVTKEDFEEVRKMLAANADMQVQLAKARAAHGAARVEKDLISERVAAAEVERDRLRTQVDELQTTMITRASDAATAEARNMELEEALAQALARLRTSDVTTQTQQERILDLEKQNAKLNSEKQALKSKAQSQEMQVTMAFHDKEVSVDALASLKRDHEALLAQQNHWEDLRRAAEQIEHLSALMSQSNEAELGELRRTRDRSKALEGEYAALQRRFRDQENKATSSDRAAASARQSLAQAQQRAAEWEQRTRAMEDELVQTKAQLEQSDSAREQLENEHSFAKLQLVEKDAQERLAQGRESTLRDQVASLEGDVARLQGELTRLKSEAKKTTAVPLSKFQNQSPPRPDSRASTIYPSRSATPTKPTNGLKRPVAPAPVRSDTPPQTSVYDSMHAPKHRYPGLGNGVPGMPKPGKPHPGGYYRPAIASPTPSVVSNAPTQRGDGWWE